MLALAVGLLPLRRLWQILQGGPVTFSGAAFPLGVLLLMGTGFVGIALANVQAGERDVGLVAAVGRRQATAIVAIRAEIDRFMAGLPALVFHRDCAADGISRRSYRGGDIAAVTGWPPAALAGIDSLVPLAPAEMSFAGCLARMLRDDTQVMEGQNRPPDRAGCGRRVLDGTVRRQLGGANWAAPIGRQGQPGAGGGWAVLRAGGPAGAGRRRSYPTHDVPTCGPKGRGAEWRPPPLRRSQAARRRGARRLRGTKVKPSCAGYHSL